MAEIVIGLAVNALIGATVSAGVGLVTRALTSKPSSNLDAVRQPSAESLDRSLAVTPDIGGPLPGIFGNRRVGGRIVFSGKSGNKTYNVIVIAGAKVRAINGVYINNRLATIDGSNNVTDLPWKQGANNSMQVYLFTGSQLAASSVLSAAFPNWTSDYKGLSIAYALVVMDPSLSTTISDAYAVGTPDFTFDVSGFDCYDPRNGAHVLGTPSTYTYSDNPAIHKANYLIHELGAALPTSLIDWASVTTAANICDEAVSLLNGGTEARYRSHVYWLTDQRHEDVLAGINAADAGAVIPPGTVYKIQSGKWTAATETITVDDYVAEGLSFSDYTPLSSRINGVRGQFASPLHNFELRDFPVYQNAAALAEDGRAEWLDVDYRFVTSAAQAQRLAKIAFMRARKGTPARVKGSFRLFNTTAGDVIAITDALAGFSAKTFRVEADEIGDDFTMGFELTAEDSTFFDWTAASEEKAFDAAAPILPLGASLRPPGGELYDSNGTVGSTLEQINLAAPPADGGADSVRYHRSRSGTVVEQVAFLPSTASAFVTSIGGASPIGTFQVRAENSVTGDVSAWNVLWTQDGTTAGDVTNGMDQKTTANTTRYQPPAPSTPQLKSKYAGQAVIGATLCPGVRTDRLQLLENTTNDSSTATVVSTVTNATTTFTVTGSPGSAKFYWLRGRNNADARNGPVSNPLLVVF